MNIKRFHPKQLLLLIFTLLSQEAFAIPIMTTGQSGSDIFVRAHNPENRNYACTVQFFWTGDGMPPNVNHKSTSTVPANTMNFLLVHHQTTLVNVRITSGPTMSCHERS
jgi:hypothetical protein